MCGAEPEGTTEQPAELSGITRRNLFLLSGAAAIGVAFAADFMRPPSATAAGTYLRPCGNVPISSSWQGHKNRRPPSGEPGTDYSVPYGTPIYAAVNGVIVDRKDTTSTATGRYLALQTDDGNYIRYLHLKNSTVSLGQSVNRGDLIAVSGASGFNEEFWYGAHVHVSLWIGGTPNQLGFTNTVDFENYVGNVPTPPDPEEDMPTYHRKQGAFTAPIGATASRLYFAAGDFDMAGGGGGAGLFQVTTHAYFTGLTPDKTLALQYYLLNPTTNVYSGGFSSTFPGVPGGVAQIEFSTMIGVPPGNYLFVTAKCAEGGVNQTFVAKHTLNFASL